VVGLATRSGSDTPVSYVGIPCRCFSVTGPCPDRLGVPVLGVSVLGFFFFGLRQPCCRFSFVVAGLATHSGSDTPVSYVGILPASLFFSFRSASILPAFLFFL
jgi:hypothetical protein